MPKEKIDLLIDGITYKDIQINTSKKWSGETQYIIDTAGVAQIMRQYVKNKYGNIKVWARISKFAGGSSVGVNLWNVPNDWYDDISGFANRFAMYNAPDGYGGDGYWRGSDVGATKIDGTKVGNTSPYMSVYNTPPYDAKERDMPPPDYSKSLPKKSSGRSTKKGFKKFGEKKTEGFELVKSCGNGWNLFVKQDTSDAPYTYRLVKDYSVKPVGKDQFYALKGDMLDTGFSWSVKAQCFEYNRFSEIPQETIKNACGVLSKYFPMTEEFKEEEATPPPTPPTTTTTTKIPLKSVTLVWDDATFNNLEEVSRYMRNEYYVNNESNLPKDGYDKYKIEFLWEDGSKVVDRIDVSSRTHDYNPFTEGIGEYLMAVWGGMDKWNIYYSKELNTDITNLSLVDSTETKPTEETEVVNLEQLISDINILVELETDNDKKMELAGYRNDLQILLSLNN